MEFTMELNEKARFSVINRLVNTLRVDVRKR